MCIEIEIPDEYINESIFPVSYVVDKVYNIDYFLDAALHNQLQIYKMVLATKSNTWEAQEEVRFLSDKQNTLVKFNGNITGIWFGKCLPYDIKMKIEGIIQDLSKGT